MRALMSLILALMLQVSVPARAETNAPFSAAPYFDNHTVDLLMILPSPPAADSADTKGELGELLVIQVSRNADMVSRAQADAVEEVWRFADVIGPKFTAENLPKTATLFARLVATDNAVVDPAKTAFARLRPHMVSDLIKPVVKLSTSGSWPSSHAALGTLMGVVLGDMLPEKRTVIMDRAWTYAENRLVAGMHFPSDIEMGRIAGSVIAAFAMKQPQFQVDYEAARMELRTALGL
ncbi:phosphatase PAP2 family protein [Lichenihabitans sp. PAMC28606]|uniref:acid phosphatase n=1 Tax=Lichenihabitans sp. PAMC28606 TaxID=2880932 RepID=UPI001D0BAAFD|nr:phosphatase PAP2 family protein [Lichenihabitans sp. PAMC28606]UDL95776.1 phosphatase PAP2 family protein [Lichenihabitans sp. PAMC28606]